MRAIIADDSVLLREGLARLLAEAGIDTTAMVGDAGALEEAVAEHHPDVVLIDIRMPPTFTHEGAQAATRLRAGGRRWASCCCPSRSRLAMQPSWRPIILRGSAIS